MRGALYWLQKTQSISVKIQAALSANLLASCLPRQHPRYPNRAYPYASAFRWSRCPDVEGGKRWGALGTPDGREVLRCTHRAPRQQSCRIVRRGSMRRHQPGCRVPHLQPRRPAAIVLSSLHSGRANEFFPQLVRLVANERHRQSHPYSQQKLGRCKQGGVSVELFLPLP